MNMKYFQAMHRLRSEWGGQCVACAVPDIPTEPLEFAHLPGKPTGLSGRGRGLPQRYHDVRSNPECYVLLCGACHLQLDRGKVLV